MIHQKHSSVLPGNSRDLFCTSSYPTFFCVVHSFVPVSVSAIHWYICLATQWALLELMCWFSKLMPHVQTHMLYICLLIRSWYSGKYIGGAQYLVPGITFFSPPFPFNIDEVFGVLLALSSGLWNLVVPVLWYHMHLWWVLMLFLRSYAHNSMRI